jgi:hypothetical protein
MADHVVTTADAGGFVQLSPDAVALGYTISVSGLGTSSQKIILHIPPSRDVEITVDPNLILGTYLVYVGGPLVYVGGPAGDLPDIQLNNPNGTVALTVPLQNDATSVAMDASSLSIPGAYAYVPEAPAGCQPKIAVTTTPPALTGTTSTSETNLMNVLTQLVSLLKNLIAETQNAATGTASPATTRSFVSEFTAIFQKIISSSHSSQ